MSKNSESRPALVEYLETNVAITGLTVERDLHVSILVGGRGLSLQISPAAARSLAQALLDLVERHEIAAAGDGVAGDASAPWAYGVSGHA